jgi:hypothetical protein
MAQLKKVYHDERRAKEQADREREEAIRFARQVAEENKGLKTTLSSGEEDYLKAIREAHEKDLALAKRDYREAYDVGDTDKVIEAQSRMNEAQYKLSASVDRKPQFKAVQADENSVDSQQNAPKPKITPPDAKAKAWQEANPWFGKDDEMTSLALGVHERLIKSGINPTSDEYYRSINDTMQRLN